jgi:ribosomal protein S24E
MNFQVLEEKENPLFKRKEIVLSVNFGGSPTSSKIELQKAAADHFKVAIESVEVSKILSEVGLSRGKAWIKIWQEKKVPIYISKKAKAAQAAPEAK